MEYSYAFGLFFIEVLIAIITSIFWRRRRSELGQAKAKFTEALKAHMEGGTLEKYLEDIEEARVEIYRKREQLFFYLCTGVSMIAGIGLVFLTSNFNLHVALKTILAILFIAPFMVFVSIVMTEEWDENKIGFFIRKTAKKLSESIENGTEEECMQELLKEIG